MTIKASNKSFGSGSIRFQYYNAATSTWDNFFKRIGNAPDITYTQEVEELTDEDAEVKGMPEDFQYPITKKLIFNFTINEMNPEAKAYHGYSRLTSEAQVASEANTTLITGASPGSIHDLGKNFTGVRKLDYDGGTVVFEVGETVTGAGGGSADVVQIIGNATSGTLYLENWNGTPFVDNEVLTGDVLGAAVANGTDAFYEYALSVEDTDAAGTFLTAGVDYRTTSRNGDIEFLPGGYCDGLTKTNFTVKFVNQAADMDVINHFTEDSIRMRLWFVTDKVAGKNFEWKTWDGILTGEGGSSLVGKTLETMEFQYVVYPDHVAHPENPWGMQRILSQA